MATLFQDCERSYREDPSYATLIHVLQGFLEQMALTPAELRAAAVYAAYLFEARRPKLHFLAHKDMHEEVMRLQGQDGHDTTSPSITSSATSERED